MDEETSWSRLLEDILAYNLKYVLENVHWEDYGERLKSSAVDGLCRGSKMGEFQFGPWGCWDGYIVARR
jgi:hypothetical protein